MRSQWLDWVIKWSYIIRRFVGATANWVYMGYNQSASLQFDLLPRVTVLWCSIFPLKLRISILWWSKTIFCWKIRWEIVLEVSYIYGLLCTYSAIRGGTNRENLYRVRYRVRKLNSGPGLAELPYQCCLFLWIISVFLYMHLSHKLFNFRLLNHAVWPVPNRDDFIYINVFYGLLIHFFPNTLYYARSCIIFAS